MAWLQIAAAVVGAIGSISQAQAAKNAANYNAQLAERNAVIARQQAAANEDAQRRHANRVLGRMRSGYGASGVTSEGSPLDVLEDSVAEAELDALNIRYQGELGAMGYQSEAAMQRTAGKNAMRQGYFRAAGSLLGAGANYYAQGTPIRT